MSITAVKIKKLYDLPWVVKYYLEMRFGGDFKEWLDWCNHYEWNTLEMIQVVENQENKPD